MFLEMKATVDNNAPIRGEDINIRLGFSNKKMKDLVWDPWKRKRHRLAQGYVRTLIFHANSTASTIDFVHLSLIWYQQLRKCRWALAVRRTQVESHQRPHSSREIECRHTAFFIHYGVVGLMLRVSIWPVHIVHQSLALSGRKKMRETFRWLLVQILAGFSKAFSSIHCPIYVTKRRCNSILANIKAQRHKTYVISPPFLESSALSPQTLAIPQASLSDLSRAQLLRRVTRVVSWLLPTLSPNPDTRTSTVILLCEIECRHLDLGPE